jgi:hypothetical protein
MSFNLNIEDYNKDELREMLNLPNNYDMNFEKYLN